MWTLFAACFAGFLLGFCKGFTDATRGDGKYHLGLPNDIWHQVGRLGLAVGAIGWFLPLSTPWGAIPYPPVPLYAPILAAILGWVGFHLGARVIGGKKWPSWTVDTITRLWRRSV